MAKLEFLPRTAKDIEIFGGDIYFDIDGKNIGILSRLNYTVDLPAGHHTIKMYKSHKYDTFIGFAESTIVLQEQEHLMVRYAAPMATNQPGNIIVMPYDPNKEQEILKTREDVIRRDSMADDMRKREQNEKYNTGVMLWIGLMIVSAIIFAIWESSIWW